MKRSEAVMAVGMIQAIWPQREFSRETIEQYVSVIEDLELAAVTAGVEELKVSLDWPPSARQLRQAALDVMPGDRMPQPDAAWSEVVEQIRAVGTKRGSTNFATGEPWQPTWSHQAVGDAAEALGWDELCMSENLVADRAHFMKFYAGAVERAGRERAITPRGRELVASLGTIGKPVAELGL